MASVEDEYSFGVLSTNSGNYIYDKTKMCENIIWIQEKIYISVKLENCGELENMHDIRSSRVKRELIVQCTW